MLNIHRFEIEDNSFLVPHGTFSLVQIPASVQYDQHPRGFLLNNIFHLHWLLVEDIEYFVWLQVIQVFNIETNVKQLLKFYLHKYNIS